MATWLNNKDRCLPLAAVFTPGTIHVQPDLIYQNDEPLKPAQPQEFWYGTQNYAATQLDFTALWKVGNRTYADVINNGPSGDLHAVALGSVSRRGILSIPPPSQNSSYELSFFGPALSCNSLSAADFSAFNTSLSAAYNNRYLPGMRTILGGVEALNPSRSLVLKYNAWVGTTDYNLSNPNWNNDTTTVNTLNQANVNYFYLSSSSSQNGSTVLVACHLHNATYNVRFSFENSQQSVNVLSVAIEEPVPYNATVDSDDPDYGNIVYNAVLDAFNNIVVGAATNDTGTEAPNILYYGSPVSVSALQDFIESKSEYTLTSDAAIKTLESMFQNITLSSMSSPSLRLPDEETKVIKTTTWRSVNIFVYEPLDLYIAYGCALLASLACVFWGLYVLLHHNHVSYSLKFSTILRTTRLNGINEIVIPESRKGNDPIPREMKMIKLKYTIDAESDEDGFAIAHGSGQDDNADSPGNTVMTEESLDRPFFPSSDTRRRPNSI